MLNDEDIRTWGRKKIAHQGRRHHQHRAFIAGGILYRAIAVARSSTLSFSAVQAGVARAFNAVLKLVISERTRTAFRSTAQLELASRGVL